MYRRFLLATMLIALSAIITLGVPFGFATTRLIRSEVVRSADERASTIAAAIDARLRTGEPITPEAVAGYDSNGQVVEITPPNQPTITVGDTHSDSLFWSRRVTSELGAQVRVGITETSLSSRTNRAWLLVAALAASGVIVALALATVLARRTSRPFISVAHTAHRLAAGDFSARANSGAGIAELDGIAQSLNTAAARITQLVAAERRFTLDASHQLRTPLTSLAIRLEEIANTDDLETAHREALAAIGHADRLLDSITELLTIARQHRNDVDAHVVDLGNLSREHAKLFEPAFRKADRTVSVDTLGDTTLVCSNGAVGQALNVLIDNALVHGRGDVTIDVENLRNGVRIRVSDQGHTPPTTTDTESALGLPLARTLIDGEGGHLTRLSTPHSTYEIFLPRRNELDHPRVPAPAMLRNGRFVQ